MGTPTSDKEKVEHQFDTLIKQVLRGEARNCKAKLAERAAHEIPFADLGDSFIETLGLCDEYLTDYFQFEVNGFDVVIKNELLGEAVTLLSEQKRKSISEYQSELEKVLSFVRSLYENYVEGIISNDEYISFKSDYSEKAANLKEKIRQAKSELSHIEETLQKRELVAKSTKAFMKNGKLTARLISLFVERIEVTHDKDVNIEYNDDMLLGKEAV